MNSQSSYATERSRNSLLCNLTRIARVAIVMHKASTVIMVASRFGGSTRLGVRPAGGSPAGPLSSA